VIRKETSNERAGLIVRWVYKMKVVNSRFLCWNL